MFVQLRFSPFLRFYAAETPITLEQMVQLVKESVTAGGGG